MWDRAGATLHGSGSGVLLTALKRLSRSLRRWTLSGCRAWLSRVEETLERKRASVSRPSHREDH